MDIAYKHFKEFELPLDIEYKSYMNIVGPKEALHAISVKRSFKAWKYLIHALKVAHPDLLEPPKPAPTPAPKAVKPSPLSKPAPAEEMDSDDE